MKNPNSTNLSFEEKKLETTTFSKELDYPIQDVIYLDKQAIVTLTTDIEPLAAISGHLHANVDRIHDAIEGIPYVGCIPSSTLQTFRMMRPVNHLAVSLVMPTTPLDVGLVGAGLAGKATKVPAALGEMATAAVKGGSKLISRFAPYVTKPTGSTNLSALDLAAPKKALAPKASVRSPAASSVKPSVEPSVKLATSGDVAPKSILKSTPAQKPASSMQRASTSYERTSSHPTCSSSSRSPQALSTAPPAEGTLSVLPSGKTFGAHKDLVRSKANDSHHVIQDAAVKDIPAYRRDNAPAIQLEGPSMKKGTEHNKATQAQRRKGGGTYGAERRIGYRALREAGVEKTESRTLIEGADQYFKSIGVEKSTKTRIPGNRKMRSQ
ncbi:MAG: hypothetical protein K2X02_08370 [Alphaproteobacteria bacterium]|nr:hypothetical protein [Alphaproteobacteria bacterium]